jgi:aldehyde:ferredoxin oxidoreductase
MKHLHAGRILRINLTDRKISSEPVDSYERFIGGKGINMKVIFDGLEAATKP